MDSSKKILDSSLVRAYQSGNHEALALLVKRWHKKFCRQAYYYTKNADEAKDVAQDSWAVIINNINNLRNPNKFGSWSLCIVTRKALDRMRAKKKTIKLENYHEEKVLPFNEEKAEDDKKKVKKAIKKLPANQQIVLQLFYVESYKVYEIATILGISIGTVKSRLFTAREKLKIIIKKREL